MSQLPSIHPIHSPLKNSKRPHILTLVLLILVSTFTSCNQRPPNADLIFINGSEPQFLDPSLITGQIEMRICRELYTGLLDRDQKGGYTEGVATLPFDLSEDKTIYTFTLRKNATWSNGDPVTAHDFLASWKRVLTPATAAEYAYILYFIKNAEEYHSGKLKDFSQVGIKALDDFTFRVTLKAPTPFFPNLVAFSTYMPTHIPTIEKFGDAWTHPDNIVTNGPYRLHKWNINDRIIMRKNQNYWNADKVHLNEIHALACSSASTAINLYLTGQVDLILDKGLIPATLLSELRQRPDFHSYDFMGNYFYRFNVTKPPLDNPLVRKALTASIDRKIIVNKITKAGENTTSALTPPGLNGYTPPSGIPFDPLQAAKYLAQAGFPEGKNFPRLSLLYNKSETNENIALEIQAMWKKHLGIDIELKNQEWASYLTTLKNLEYDIARSSWVGDYPDPNTFLDCFIATSGNNRTGWKNETYDQLISQASLEANPEKRNQIFYQAEEILVQKEAPIAPIYYYTGILFYDADRIKGILPNVIAEHPIHHIHLTTEKNK